MVFKQAGHFSARPVRWRRLCRRQLRVFKREPLHPLLSEVDLQTRVGSGPFPTELKDSIGEGIAGRGREVGTTTGRPRRVGWFDAVPLRYAVAVNSVSAIMLNKLDILSGIPELCLCVAYQIDGPGFSEVFVVQGVGTGLTPN